MSAKWCCHCQKDNHDCWECHSTRTVRLCCSRMAKRDAEALPEKRINPPAPPMNPLGAEIRKMYGGTWS